MGRRGDWVEVLISNGLDSMTFEGKRSFVFEKSEYVDEIGVSVIIIHILVC